MRLLIALISMTIVFVGCGQEKEKPTRSDNFTMRNIRDRRGCDTSDTHCLRVEFIYPTPDAAMRPALADSLRAIVRRMIVTSDVSSHGSIGDAVSLSQFSQMILAGFESMRAEFPDAASFAEQFEEHFITIVGDTLGLMTLKHEANAFAGGAHPISRIEYRMLDRETGATVTFAEIVDSADIPELTAQVERQFRSVRQLPADTSLTAAGFWFENDEFRLPEQIAVTFKGLRFYYNHYEVAPYAWGSTDVLIPWSELGVAVGR